MALTASFYPSTYRIFSPFRLAARWRRITSGESIAASDLPAVERAISALCVLK